MNSGQNGANADVTIGIFLRRRQRGRLLPSRPRSTPRLQTLPEFSRTMGIGEQEPPFCKPSVVTNSAVETTWGRCGNIGYSGGEFVHRTTPTPMNFDRHGLLTKLGFATLTCNSALAIYRSRDDPGSVAFVVGAYGAIALLFYFLRRFQRGEGDRGGTKAVVWALTTLLTAMFASRVAPLMPPAVGFLVWSMSAATAGAGFWALFLNP